MVCIFIFGAQDYSVKILIIYDPDPLFKYVNLSEQDAAINEKNVGQIFLNFGTKYSFSLFFNFLFIFEN